MKKLKKVDLVIAYILGGVSLFVIIIALLDIQSAYQDPDTYEMVHHKSIAEYVRESYFMIAAFAVSLLFSVMTIVDEKRVGIWKIALYVSVFSLIGFIIYGYISWAATGFDH